MKNKNIIRLLFIQLFILIFTTGCNNLIVKNYEKAQIFNRFYSTNNQSMAIMYPVGQEGVVERATIFIENAIKSKGYYAVPAEYGRQLMLEAGINSGDELWDHRFDSNPQLKDILGSDLLVYPIIKGYYSSSTTIGVGYEIEIHHALSGLLYYKYSCSADAVPQKSQGINSGIAIFDLVANAATAIKNLTIEVLFAIYADYNLQLLAKSTAEKCLFNIPVGPFHDIYLGDGDNIISVAVPKDKADDLSYDDAMEYTTIEEHYEVMGKGLFRQKVQSRGGFFFGLF